MKAKFQPLPQYLSSCLIAVIVAISTSGCSGGTNSNQNNPRSKQLTLHQYISQLDYQPIASQDQAQSQTKQAISLKTPSLTKLGNQQIFTAIAPVTLTTIQMNYYSDEHCDNLTYSTTIGQEEPITLPAGSYSTTDQSNYSLCSVYKLEGCAQEFSDSQQHDFSSIRFDYNLANGSTVSSACMYNFNLKTEALADYSDQVNPSPCSEGSACGYSEEYGAQLLSIPSIATTISAISPTTTTGYNCLLDGSISNNLRCWGNNSIGILGNNVASPYVPASVVMPNGVTAFGNIVISKSAGNFYLNTQTICAIALGGEEVGKVYCWGSGAAGQIGDGNQQNVSIPTPVTMPTGVTSFSSISAGSDYFCGIGDDENAYCWGSAYNGNLGTGVSVASNPVPIKVNMPIGVKFKAISSNESFSCALSTDGKAYCWGANYVGQIGTGDYQSPINEPTPVQMPADVTFDSISTNYSFSCALATNGKAYCWGLGFDGHIGNNSQDNATTATAVNMPEGITFTSLTTYLNYSCAITNDQRIYCWGSNYAGQIGNNTKNNALVPTAVVMPAEISGFSQVAINTATTCAIAIAEDNGTQSHPIYCWGSNYNGLLGINNSDMNFNATEPQKVVMPNGVTSFTHLTAGYNNFCAIGDNNKTYCWGRGADGQIGNSNLQDALVPTAVNMPQGITNFTSLTLENFNVCAIANNQHAYCWGARTADINADNLGRGNRIEPVLTNVTMPEATQTFNAVSIANKVACAIAGRGSNLGQIFCWGDGSFGQIGNGETFSVTKPTHVNQPEGVSSFTKISTTDNFSCAIANTGTIYCWGNNISGQIGNNSTSNALVPSAVQMPGDVTSFSTLVSNNDYSCALANNTQIYCWGYGYLGQLGKGGSTMLKVPTAVNLPDGVNGFRSLTSNNNFSCALADNNKTYCWGYGSNGQIGNGQNSYINNSPTQVKQPPEVNKFTQLATSDGFSCAIADNGKAYCWGSGNYGQIGNGQALAINNEPQAVNTPNGITFKMIATASVGNDKGVACAIANNGKAYCWGNGSLGQIGNGQSQEINSEPSEVTMPPGVNSFGYIYTSGITTCAIAASGSNAGKTYCWGGGSSGQIGNGATLNVNIPTQVISVN